MVKAVTKSPSPPHSWASLIFQLYLAGVCGFSLMVGTFSAAGLMRGVLDLAYPPRVMVVETRWDDATKTEVPRPAAEIARERAQQAADQAFNTRRELAHSGIYLLLVAGVFAFHWRLFKARKE